MSFLGIDIGATFIKAAWLDVRDGIVGNERRLPFPSFIPNLPTSYREVSPDEILIKVYEILSGIVETGKKCDGLLISGQMHGFVLVGKQGDSRSNFISWQDTRCLDADHGNTGSFFEIAGRLLGKEKISVLGNELRPGLPIATLFAMDKQGMLERGCWPASLPDYVAYRLTGKRGPIHSTLAAAHGMLDVTKLNWHQSSIRTLNLEHLIFPEVTNELVRVGKCELGSQCLPVYTPIGDQQAALFGVGLEEGEISVNVATGSQVSMITSESTPGAWQLRPYLGKKWLRTVTHLPAGRSLNKLVELFLELSADDKTNLDEVWALIARKCDSVKIDRITANITFFPCPLGNEGSFTGLNESEISVGHFLLAACRSMAENYKHAADLISVTGWKRVVLSGGLIQKFPALVREIECSLHIG
jgi:sugar (pentulose or hexulose) kinase